MDHSPGTMITTTIGLMANYFFFNDTATTEIYTLSLHDALPIRRGAARRVALRDADPRGRGAGAAAGGASPPDGGGVQPRRRDQGGRRPLPGDASGPIPAAGGGAGEPDRVRVRAAAVPAAAERRRT